jgi:ABC-type transporter lipoprotein component MlaA
MISDPRQWFWAREAALLVERGCLVRSVQRRLVCFMLALAAAGGCRSGPHQARDWSGYTGPGAAYFNAEEVIFPYEPDPLEPVNRISALVNYKMLRWVLAPLAAGYRWIVPSPVRKGLARAGGNLRYPTRLINNLLQGKLRQSWVETERFAVNSTVGILGFLDPAQRWGLHPHPEDFGQTFARWGWRRSTYLFLPFLGPSSVRDGLGEVPDALSDPASYFFPAPPALAFNALSNHVEADLRLIEGSYDSYEAGRTLHALQRGNLVKDFRWRQDQSGPTQTLRSVFLKPLDEKFGSRAKTLRLQLPGHTRRLPYELWLQAEPGPLMFVIPGLGGHRQGAATLALAEIAFEQGHSVVAVSNPTNWEFMASAASVSVPGNAPIDARDLHLALTYIDRELEARYPGRFQSRRVVGLSMGAYHVLCMAAENVQPGLSDGKHAANADAPEHARISGAHAQQPASAASELVSGAAVDGRTVEPGLRFDLCVALNPPVSIEHGLRQLDRFYNAPLSLPAAGRQAAIEEIYAKVLYLSNGDLQPGTALPFSELESQFLIGLAFRLDLQFMILQSQTLEDQGVLLVERTALRRAAAFRESAEYSFLEYMYAFALPYFCRQDPTLTLSERGAEELFDRMDLRRIGAALSRSPAVRVFTNKNDFLLRTTDLDWLGTTLGTRLTVREEGGHLGNPYREYIRGQIAALLNGGRAADAAHSAPNALLPTLVR